MSHSFSSNWIGLDFTFIVGCIENPGGATGISPGLGRFNSAQSLGCSWKKLQIFNFWEYFFYMQMPHSPICKVSFVIPNIFLQNLYFWYFYRVSPQSIHHTGVARKISEHQKPRKGFAPLSLLSRSIWLSDSLKCLDKILSQCQDPVLQRPLLQMCSDSLGVVQGSASRR